jgi:hypothetical protein
MKDRPAMGNAGYSISTTLTGDSGEEFLSLLTDSQRQKITSLVDLSRADLSEIVTTRQKIATELRRPLTGGIIDENAVRTLSERYGELDGEIAYNYATHFAEVGKTLTSEQKAKMVALRNLAGYTCEGAYLYSQPISMPQNIPSDFLFGKGAYDAAAMTAWLQGQQQSVASRGQGSAQSGQGQKEGTGQTGPGGKAPTQGNANQQGQGSGQRPGRGMPLDEIIAQLGQKGYDITGITMAVQSDDREAQKAWLDTFRTNNPGVAEAIEVSWTGNNPGGNGGTGPSVTNNAPHGLATPANKSILDVLREWLFNL